MNIRIGHGLDAHRFIDGRPLMLAGIHVPYPLGLEGHSDADVAIHALIDALLGAAGLDDIGSHFPDSDTQYKNIDSTILLKKTLELLRSRHFQIGNVDLSIVLEEPRLRPHIESMKARLAGLLDIPKDRISVKATTTETMGFTGRKEGILAMASVILF